MIREPPPFFHRGPSPLARLTFFTIVAVALMIADHRFHALDALRVAISVVVQPVQRVVAMPAEALGRVADYFTTQDRLLKENAELKSKVLEQSAAAQETKLLRAEHEYLLGIAPGKSRFATNGIVAEVLYNARNPFTRKIVVDKGLAQDVRPGMPVIDGSGVVGQVTHAGTFTSEVTLVTEKDQSVPVMVVRSGLRAVAVGSGKDGAIEVPFMPISADIETGDLFVTSGIDGTYPPGLVVAKAETVDRNPAYAFAKIVARPAAGVENQRYVMVLPIPAAAPPRPEPKVEERKTLREKGKGRRDAPR